MKQRPLALFVALSVLSGSGCGREPAAELSTPTAAPGETLGIRLGSFRGNINGIRVTMDGTPVHVLRAAGSEIDVIVPPGTAESTTVAVHDGDRTVATLGLRLLRPRSKRLLLSFDRSGATLVRATPSNHPPTGYARTRRTRLSFDVVNRNGVVVYSGSIRHPARQRVEQFSGSETGGAASFATESGQKIVFPLYLPFPEDSVRIDLYEAGPGLDLKSDDARRRRKLVKQIEVSP